jgi:Flp pilus assembly protein TadG
MKKRPCALTSSRGQGLVEFALVLPLALLIVLGVIELSYALLDEHIVTRLSREGSNLISRDTSLQDAGIALTSMAAPPVNFTSGSSLIFSVLEVGATTGTANYDKLILYERYKLGAFACSSHMTTAGTGSFGGAPNYQAANSDNDTSLQITSTNVTASLIPIGGLLYITEICTNHAPITPLGVFAGVLVPTTLYSVAYF